MRFAFYTNSVSAHQLPLARALRDRVGAENFRYFSTQRTQGGAQDLACDEPWIVRLDALAADSPVAADWLENAEVMIIGGLRPIDLIERRAAKGLRTFYQSERWFKPIPRFHLLLPGWLRLFSPGYFRMARRFVATVRAGLEVLAIGPWAERDFRLLYRLFARGESAALASRLAKWGYFVEPSAAATAAEKLDSSRFRDYNGALPAPQPSAGAALKVLWIGRLLRLKRVGDVLRAVYRAESRLKRAGDSLPQSAHYRLTVVGAGPEEARLKSLAVKLERAAAGASTDAAVGRRENICEFRPPVPLAAVRELMRAHDVVVLSSNAEEGWGAVVSEALSEGVAVVGTFETGASAALLPRAQLYHAGDWRGLCARLEYVRGEIAAGRGAALAHTLPEAFSPAAAARFLTDGCDFP